MLSIRTGLLLGQGKYTADNIVLLTNAFEELTDDTQFKMTDKVTHFGDKQPVKGIDYRKYPITLRYPPGKQIFIISMLFNA